ncbi:hypothetical protein GCM10009102_16230 [Sphingomonas insulae]|uniref:Uncharacterized protein n=1 Tax=Sphingomonas insulae TaxID=424800 RepID=A0ABN1HTU4_9SPHN
MDSDGIEKGAKIKLRRISTAIASFTRKRIVSLSSERGARAGLAGVAEVSGIGGEP